MPVGKRIYLKRNLPDPEVVNGFRGIPAANVADVMNRNCAMNPRIHLVSDPQEEVTVGTAYTVKARSGDNLAIHAAMQYIGKGDFLVVSNEGETSRSLIGDIMLSYLCYQKKIAGVIIDGPIRDLGDIRTWDFPIYATGSCPGGPYKEGPGEVNVPISCGEISVNPGDIILADRDGIIVIPREDAATVLPAAKEFQEKDQSKILLAKQGGLNRDWVDRLLEEKGFEILDEVYGR